MNMKSVYNAVKNVYKGSVGKVLNVPYRLVTEHPTEAGLGALSLVIGLGVADCGKKIDNEEALRLLGEYKETSETPSENLFGGAWERYNCFIKFLDMRETMENLGRDPDSIVSPAKIDSLGKVIYAEFAKFRLSRIEFGFSDEMFNIDDGLSSMFVDHYIEQFDSLVNEAKERGFYSDEIKKLEVEANKFKERRIIELKKDTTSLNERFGKFGGIKKNDYLRA